MDSFERLDRAIALQSTPEIPVYPHIVTFAGRCAGITQAQLFSSNQSWLDACDKTFARVGKLDVVTSSTTPTRSRRPSRWVPTP
jgi:hypothetical protein